MTAGDLVKLKRGMGRIPLLQKKDFYAANNGVVTRVNSSSLLIVLAVEFSQENSYDSCALVLTEKGHVGWAYVHDFDGT